MIAFLGRFTVHGLVALSVLTVQCAFLVVRSLFSPPNHPFADKAVQTGSSAASYRLTSACPPYPLRTLELILALKGEIALAVTNIGHPPGRKRMVCAFAVFTHGSAVRKGRQR